MPILNLLLTFALARAAQLEKRELLATFDDLADAGEDLGDARSIGPYNGLDFPIDWGMSTASTWTVRRSLSLMHLQLCSRLARMPPARVASS